MDVNVHVVFEMWTVYIVFLTLKAQYTTAIDENTPASTTIIAVSASDLDLQDNQQLTYTIEGSDRALEYFAVEQV